MKTLIALALAAYASFAHAGQISPNLPLDQCKVQAPNGFPHGQKQRTSMVCHPGFVLEHDDKAKIPVWVAYVLTPAHAAGCYPRVSHFVHDQALPADVDATMKDYAKSGYDIGHQANDSDMRWSAQTEADSNVFPNAAPQLPGFNRGIWKKLEDLTRGWALSRQHDIQVFVGPVYGAQDKTIGNGVVVPHEFFKILIDLQTNEAVTYLFKHEPSTADMGTFVTSPAEVQHQTGVTFPMPPGTKFENAPWEVDLKNAVSTKKSVCMLH